MSGARSVLARARQLGLPAYGDDEVLFMASALVQHRPTHVFDWGTNVGASARIFYEAAQVLDYPCDVHSIELPLEEAWRDRDHPGEGRYAELLHGIPVTLHLGDGLAVSLELCEQLAPERALFFLDGSHDHDVVLNELEMIAVERPEAVMLVHDTQWRPSGAAVADFLQMHPGLYERKDVLSTAGMTALWPVRL